MVYTGLELLMDNLNQLIYCNDNPLINNHPEIISKRPQIQLLYEKLSFMIKLLFVEKQYDQHELEEVRNLKTRYKHVVREAHSMIGSFVFFINAERILNTRFDFRYSLNLDDMMRSIESINNNIVKYLNSLNMDGSESLKTQDPGTSSAGNSTGKRHVMEEMVVGLDCDAEIIRDQLAQDQKQLDIVSIVGTGGLGKTTLATMVFNDPFVVYHFHVRAWVTISRTYVKRDFLIQILTSIGIATDHDSDTDSQLRGKLHKSLMGKRYLIVVDDIWSIQAWNDLRRFFPNENTGSRILLTSRLKEVALHAKSHGFIHQLDYLTDEKSWELLRNKVFHGNDCPKSLVQLGTKIAKNCHGLPLAVVVIAGVLAKAVTKDAWDIISENTSSYIASDRKGYADILALSYDHLPPHLKDCFLYLGRFPEDYKFRVGMLTWLWVAEGFIQESRNQSLEEIAEDYLMELVDRNLVVVADRKFDGSIKACFVHDLLRDLCREKITEENLCLRSLSCLSPPRIFIDVNSLVNNFFNQPGTGPGVQSLLCFHRSRSVIHIPNHHFFSYPLLMVLDLQMCRLREFPQDIQLLVHLRYLAFWYTENFPSSICNLWSLQTLIVKCFDPFLLPYTISNLVNLRHFRSDRPIYFKSIEKPMNLQTISRVSFIDGAEGWVKYIPGIKKLVGATRANDDHDFASLTSLGTLLWTTLGLVNEYDRQSHSKPLFEKSPMLFSVTRLPELQKMQMRLPPSLKVLSLAGCCLPWSDMSIIQSLPNLEVLKILDMAFMGPRWKTGKEQFRQLKFLKLQRLNIRRWQASSTNFPCLKRLVVDGCEDLKEIPLELGDIPTLYLIEVDQQNESVVESLHIIQQEQHNVGNDDLKINIRKEVRSHNYWKLAGVN